MVELNGGEESVEHLWWSESSIILSSTVFFEIHGWLAPNVMKEAY